MLRCRLCSQTFEELPSDAVQIGGGKKGQYKRFVINKVTHDLIDTEWALKRTHRFHKIPKPNCSLCPQPESEPISEVIPEPEIKPELKLKVPLIRNATMTQAFEELFKGDT